MPTMTPSRAGAALPSQRTSPPHIIPRSGPARRHRRHEHERVPALAAVDDAGLRHALQRVMQLAVSIYLSRTVDGGRLPGPHRADLRPLRTAAGHARLARHLSSSPRSAVFLRRPPKGLSGLTDMLQGGGGPTGIVLSRAVVRDLYPPAESASMIGL